MSSNLPSGDYVIYSLVNGPLGSACIRGPLGSFPVIVPSPGSYPQKFHVDLVDESNHVYVITVDGKNTRYDGRLVYASYRDAQKWVITYRELQNAYTIAKFTTSEAWTEPDQGRRRDPCNSRQICLEGLAVVNRGDCCYIRPDQLFRFKRPHGHKLPNGNYRIRSMVSNQLLGTQLIVGRRPAHPAVVPVPSAAPQTFTVQQVNGLEDTYLITSEGQYTRDVCNAVYAIQSSPAQQWVVTHRQQPDAYTITKLNTRQAWTEPDQYGRDGRRKPDILRQIRLEPLTTTNQCVCSDICPNQLFRFEAVSEHRPPSGNSRMCSSVPNQPGTPAIVPAHPQTSPTANPVATPVHSATPQTPTVQQVNGLEGTYVVKIQRMRTGG